MLLFLLSSQWEYLTIVINDVEKNNFLKDQLWKKDTLNKSQKYPNILTD